MYMRGGGGGRRWYPRAGVASDDDGGGAAAAAATTTRERRERVLVSSFRSAAGRKGIILIANSLAWLTSFPPAFRVVCVCLSTHSLHLICTHQAFSTKTNQLFFPSFFLSYEHLQYNKPPKILLFPILNLLSSLVVVVISIVVVHDQFSFFVSLLSN